MRRDVVSHSRRRLINEVTLGPTIQETMRELHLAVVIQMDATGGQEILAPNRHRGADEMEDRHSLLGQPPIMHRRTPS